MELPHIAIPDLAANWVKVQERIAQACHRAGRSPDSLTVIAVTKTHSPEVISKAYALGIRHFGENRVQEAIEKYSTSDTFGQFPDSRLHLIGHLQRNKIRKALQIFDYIDTVDTVELARLLDIEAGNRQKQFRVLLEVNTSGEPQKFGAEPDSTLHLASMVLGCRNLRLSGLMTVGPNVDDTARVRESFRVLKKIFDDIGHRLKPEFWSVLSMGMSGDFEIAVEEGATELRLGTALFGSRINAT